MESMIKNEINDLVRDNKIYRYIFELQNSKNENEKIELQNILNELQNNKPKNISSLDNLKNHINEIECMKFKKIWSRLKDFQKEDRLLKFLNSLEFKNDIKEKIINLFNDGKLNSSKDVEYDNQKCEIISLKCLEKDENDNYFIKEKNSKKLKK